MIDFVQRRKAELKKRTEALDLTQKLQEEKSTSAAEAQRSQE